LDCVELSFIATISGFGLPLISMVSACLAGLAYFSRKNSRLQTLADEREQLQKFQSFTFTQSRIDRALGVSHASDATTSIVPSQEGVPAKRASRPKAQGLPIERRARPRKPKAPPKQAIPDTKPLTPPMFGRLHTAPSITQATPRLPGMAIGLQLPRMDN
jgi:hypothetical protein